MGDSDGGMPDLAERLNHLFATVPRPDRQGYWTNEQAAAELARLGTPMSHAYLSQLRTGKRDNPSARHLAAIAELFAVPMEYFFNTEIADKIDADLRLLAAIRDSGVKGVALRAHGASTWTRSFRNVVQFDIASPAPIASTTPAVLMKPQRQQ